MNALGALRALIRKDLRVFASDRRAMIVSFAVPAVLATMMGFIFKGGGEGAGVPHVRTLLVDHDDRPDTHTIDRKLTDDPMLHARLVTEDEARDAVRKGDADVAVVVPAGFAEKAASAFAGHGEPPELILLYDPTHKIEQTVAQGVVHRHVVEALETAADDAGRALAKSCTGVITPFQSRAEVVAAQAGDWNGAAHMLAGMGVQFILFGAIENAVAILTDRQRGLWKRLQAAPLSHWVLLASKIISGAIIACAVLAFMFAFGQAVLGVRIQGSFAGFALVAVSFAFMAATMGVLISTLGKTPQTTRSFSIFAMLILVMLSGAWFPSFLFPPWLRQATLFIPTRWAVDGLDGMVWRGLDFQAALLPSAILLGTAAVLGTLAALRFRWEE